jgi:hypothetical protein
LRSIFQLTAVSYSNDRFGTSDNAGDWRRRYRIVSDDVLKRWPVSKRVNSSKAPADDPTLIDKVAAYEARQADVRNAAAEIS